MPAAFASPRDAMNHNANNDRYQDRKKNGLGNREG
jgi:hypothetical protein